MATQTKIYVGDTANFQINHEGEFINNAIVWVIAPNHITFVKDSNYYVMPRALMELDGACELVSNFDSEILGLAIAS